LYAALNNDYTNDDGATANDFSMTDSMTSSANTFLSLSNSSSSLTLSGSLSLLSNSSSNVGGVGQFYAPAFDSSFTGTNEYLEDLARHMSHPQTGVKVKTRKVGLLKKKQNFCFVAQEAVTWLVMNVPLSNRQEAIVLGNRLLAEGLIQRSENSSSHGLFKDQRIYYQFNMDKISMSMHPARR
jgi:hypothetical protein